MHATGVVRRGVKNSRFKNDTHMADLVDIKCFSIFSTLSCVDLLPQMLFASV
jgi:hypothetical protein